MANLNSAQYLAVHVNKFLADARDIRGRAVPLPFSYVIGADVVADTVNLCVIPANSKVVGLDVCFEAMGGTATMTLGDAGVATRYLASTSVVAAGRANGLLVAGQNYEPTADAIVLATWGGSNPTPAARLEGVLWVIPGV